MRLWGVSEEVERIPSPYEADELDRLAFEKRSALRSIEGRPAKGALDACQSPM